ncbi:hypothetical protein [Novosphingobium sp.]|uniref:hypothetical protein n=1 Tax=Novosphingobium sp. TaxID=1874826 RepID=UPI0025DEF304|nr:hypothetical protein [Novosphingobium sp.]MCC6925621.1 hypothetical protein [Novosphingobium sp.]
MNRKLIAIAIVAGLALPGVAQARTTRAELRRDVAAVHHEQRDLRQELRQHDWRDARQERRELSRAKQELREDSRAYWRQHHRRH